MIKPMRCMSCGRYAPDGMAHECSQSRIHHDDMPGTVMADNSDGDWQKLVLPLDYEQEPLLPPPTMIVEGAEIHDSDPPYILGITMKIKEPE